MAGTTKELTIFHFNDVYHGSATKDGGGAAQFLTVLDRERAALSAGTKSLTLFSGDVFNPSLESSISKGQHLVPVLNLMGIDASVYGNHDFDFGVPQLVELAGKTNFPWLLSNVWEESGELLAKGRESLVLDVDGTKVGIIGLVEKEWLDTIVSLPPNLVYKDFCAVGRSLAQSLRAEHACTVVVALTHMRQPNDELLAASVPEIDLVLGGHDHFVQVVADAALPGAPRGRPGAVVVKSGTDFRDLGVLTLHLDPDTRAVVDVQVRHTSVPPETPATPSVAALLADIQDQLARKLQKAVAITHTPLDARSASVRLEESAVGSFVADVVRRAYDADIALLCGGTIRSDAVYGPGEITIRDVMEMFPFEDPVVVIDVTGEQVWGALENGVSMWPKQEGRFPQVSGLSFEFDPSLPPGSRVLSVTMTCTAFEHLPLDRAQTYRVATRNYLADGHDGFTSLVPHTTVVDDESGMLITTILRKYFLGLKTVKAMSRLRAVPRADLVADHPHDGAAAAELAAEVGVMEEEARRTAFACFQCVHTVRGDQRWGRFKKIAAGVTKLPVIAPVVDGRITRVRR
ncbi:hypothetical protein H9P43_002899 [Blastocladiella emersonii ATCC 22665]|nr:hypothetical protein H9P43_002899 [Blastocladiella emersonii ATCC 22665]